MASQIYTAPAGAGAPVLGRTLTSFLDEAVAHNPNQEGFSQLVDGRWESLSTVEFADRAGFIAAGLRTLGCDHGDRVAMFMHSNVDFCVVDMGCLIAGLANVPIYITHAEESIHFVIKHSEAEVLFVSDEVLYADIHPLLKKLDRLRTIIMVRPAAGWMERGGESVPERIELLTLDDVMDRGRRAVEADPAIISRMKNTVQASDVATIIYTSGTTGDPKGVMLTHENISSNVMGSFGELSDLRKGPQEVAISFLPLTHIFARALQYGFMLYGTTIYYCTPDEVGERLREVKPTVFASVPRVIERVYEKIVVKMAQMTGLRKLVANWAMGLAKRYDMTRRPGLLMSFQLGLADKLVFSKWREALGGRVKYIIAGGAALSAELTNLFAAAGVTILQGYGLTETSPVITYNRPENNRPGTVGQPIPGVEVTLTDDGEILARGPNIMKGYYKNDEATASVLEKDGWFHTGDIGEFTGEGFLKITDRKKDMFKLSTGKYVIPQPIENKLMAEPLVEQAVVVGAGRKYATTLIFPNQDNLRVFARINRLPADLPVDQLLRHPAARARFQKMIDKANRGLQEWTTVKKFTLVPSMLTIEEGFLTPTLKVRRKAVREHFAEPIDSMYAQDEEAGAMEEYDRVAE